MATKTARVIEVLRSVYPTAKTVTRCEDIDADFVLIEPLYFTMTPDDIDPVKTVKQLKEHPARKILYCSEKSIFRMDPDLRTSLIDACDVVTVNCKFMRNLFDYLQTNIQLHWLCDPVPDVFFNPGFTEKKKQILATGYIAWHKNTADVIEVFKRLEGTTIERKYIGSNGLWSNVPISNHSRSLQSELYKNCDSVIEEVARDELAYEMRRTRFGLWLAYHDTFSFSTHEMMMSGVLIMGSNHGLASEIPARASGSVEEQVKTIKRVLAKSDDVLDKESKKVANWARKRVSFDAFFNQFKVILNSFN